MTDWWKGKSKDQTQTQFKVTWHDAMREPQHKPNPAYPNGIDIDYTNPEEKKCFVPLPYPAKRIGYYLIKCRICDMTVTVTTAGRSDDPRSVKIPCMGFVS
jgi:hypothetical protein